MRAAAAEPLSRPRRSTAGIAARLMACLVVFSFVFVSAVPEPVDARPRSSKSRGGKARKARPPAVEEVKLPPQPAPEDIPPLPERRTAQPPTEWPRATVPLGPEPPPEDWPEPAIKEALADCRKLLGDVRFEFKELSPIRKGVCGTPAPIQLKYVNDVPRVELRPAATMSCPLAGAINRWLDEVVQPRAKELLDATVIRIVNLAAYDCRTRYGTPTQRMSYHAYGEAIDIAEFEANEAHRNHFHVDIAKRRRSAYCQ
jgi:hypothetical protein